MPIRSVSWSRLWSVGRPSRASSGRNLAAAAVGLLMLAACNRGDVGAPCNHGILTRNLTNETVTFPALSCDELLCVYADESEPPEAPCQVNEDCNTDGQTKFFCDKEPSEQNGTCALRIDHILERSMCSKRCNSNDDCRNGGITDQVVVDETACSGNFQCVRLQELGEFCCEKFCVCEDDISFSQEMQDLNEQCETGQLGCCMTDDPPEGCGPS